MASEKKEATHPGETALGIFSGLAVLGLCGFLLASALSRGGEPPDIRLSVEDVRESASGHHVDVAARNLGDKTAANVLFRGVSAGGEVAEARFDYVPPGSERKATLVFSTPVSASDVTLSISGYTDP